MTLGFSIEIKGKPTYFPNKIVKSIRQNYGCEMNQFLLNSPEPPANCFGDVSVFQTENLAPKIHTIRRDKNNRWKAGNDIHFVIGNQTKNRFQFAPVLPCVSVQLFEVQYLKPNDPPLILIDGKVFDPVTNHGLKSVEELAKNDGFDDFKDFCNWFSDDFKGKIIHWTNKKY